ncbi:MAG: tetratricopeptide repeat protein [Gammaproteobacteria bacterium]|jgi:tetratricopeptide (TPR) repeat protein
MNPTSGLRVTLVLLYLLAWRVAGAADALTELPVAWKDTLRPVPEISLAGLGENTRAAINKVRKRANTALQNGAAPAALAEIYGELGGLYHVYNLYQTADACYENAMQLDPENFRWNYYSAYLAAETGQTELAISRFRRASEIRPGYKALYVRLADVHRDLNQLDKAAALYRDTVDEAGLEAASLYGLGQIALLRRDFGGAIENFTRALEFEPEATRIHYPLAQALHAVKRTDEARQHLALRGNEMPTIMDPQIDSLEEIKGGAGIEFLHAMRAIKQHDNETAREAFARGLAQQPDNVLARISYARTLYLTNDKAGARRELEAALARQADNTLALFLLGVLTEGEGDPDRAADYYRQVLQHDPAHAGANFYLANRYYRQNLPAKAASHYAATIQADPKNKAAYMPLLDTLRQTGATDAVLMTHLLAGLRQFPEYALFRTMQTRLLATSNEKAVNRPEEALNIARELVEQAPIPPHREVLALALAATGDFEQAAAIQEGLVAIAAWSMPGGGPDLDHLDRLLTAYRDGKLPSPAVMAEWPISRPPQFYADAPFRNYPAAKPY